MIETYNCLQNLVNHEGIPIDAAVFYCCFSMCASPRFSRPLSPDHCVGLRYQPEDGAEGGLSIQAQIDMKPFARIIESRPIFGMWCASCRVSHEPDVCVG